MAEQGQTINGDYSLYATGSLTIGAINNGGVYIHSDGVEGGTVFLDADLSISMYCADMMFGMSGLELGEVYLVAGELGTIQIRSGLPLEGAIIQMSPEEMMLSVGPPGEGSRIILTPESITLQVAEVMLVITPEGITETVAEVTREATPEGHNLTAGETVWNLGVEGSALEAPTKEEEIEGCLTSNQTLEDHTTDGVCETEAGIEMVE